MNWALYRTFCENRGWPLLVAPCGFTQVGDHHYRQDGYLWIGKGRRAKKVAPYLVVERYNGQDVLLRRDDKSNARRFEALRWKILNHIERLKGRLVEVRDALEDLCCREKRVRGGAVVAVGHYQDRWYEVVISDGPFMKSKQINVDEIGVLDQMATLTRSEEEYRLVGQYMRLRDLLDSYYRKATRFEDCLLRALRDKHPYKEKPWGCPTVEFIINGRTYPMADPCLTSGSGPTRTWPSPNNIAVNLDE